MTDFQILGDHRDNNRFNRFILNNFRVAIPGTCRNSRIKRDFRKDNYGGGLLSSAACTCVCYVLHWKTKKEKKTVDEVVAEKTESTWFRHFVAQAVGDAFRSARSHWVLRISHYIWNRWDSNLVGNINIMSVNSPLYSIIWADNRFRPALNQERPRDCWAQTQNLLSYALLWGSISCLFFIGYCDSK